MDLYINVPDTGNRNRNWQLAYERFLAWTRYLHNAEIMRSISVQTDIEVGEPSEPANQLALSYRRALRDYFFSSLHIVIEGWEELGLSDEYIGELLSDVSGLKDKLRRLRNATFHYQPRIDEPRLSEFRRSEASFSWAMLLHEEFKRFLYDCCNPSAVPGLRKNLGEYHGWVPEMPKDSLQATEEYVRWAERLLLQTPPGSLNHEKTKELHAAALRARSSAERAEWAWHEMKAVFVRQIKESAKRATRAIRRAS